MINIQIVDYPLFLAFFLAFTRWVALMIQLPLFDGMPIPGIVKILMALVLTYAFFPIIRPDILQDIAHVGEDNFWILTIFNALTGFVLGFLVKSIMDIFTATGAIITQQIGFAAVSYFDPGTARQMGPFEKIIQWTILVMILSSGALMPMLKGSLATFDSISFYNIGRLASSPLYFIDLFKSIFLSALLLASPLIFTNILMMTLLGIIARVVPQVNVIMMSFIVNIGLGLLVFAITAQEFFYVAFRIYTEKLGQWFQFVS